MVTLLVANALPLVGVLFLGWTVFPLVLVHFGGFTYIHGVLVVALFGPKGAQPFDLLTTVPAAVRANQLGWLLGSPLPGLAMLVVIKTAADWRAHRAERQKFAITSTTATNRPFLDDTANR